MYFLHATKSRFAFHRIRYKEANMICARNNQLKLLRCKLCPNNNMVLSRSHPGQLPNTDKVVFCAPYITSIPSTSLTFNCPLQAPRPSYHPFLEGACLRQCFLTITWLHQLFYFSLCVQYSANK